jgi:hypothetical protein
LNARSLAKFLDGTAARVQDYGEIAGRTWARRRFSTASVERLFAFSITLTELEQVSGFCFRHGLSSIQVTPDQGMNWTTHYFDRRLNRDSVSRAFASKEDALARPDAAELRCAFRQGPERRKNRCCRDHCVVQGSSDAQRPRAFKVAAKPTPPHVFVRMHTAISHSGRCCQRAWPLSHITACHRLV